MEMLRAGGKPVKHWADCRILCLTDQNKVFKERDSIDIIHKINWTGLPGVYLNPLLPN